jgi:hypothetical protein
VLYASVVVKSGLENPRLRPYEIRRTDHATPLYPQKLALTSPTSGGRSVGIVGSQTKATELVAVYDGLRNEVFEVVVI